MMETITIPPLVKYLAPIADPRNPRGTRHPLSAILGLCCVALLCGAKNLRGVAQWWCQRQDLGPFLERLGFTKDYGPSAATLYRVWACVSRSQLAAGVQQWAEAVLSACPPPPGALEVISCDGKTLRGSRQPGAADTHWLSVFSHRLGLTIKQLGVADKTNEIGAMPELLADLVLEGRGVTLDALHTQRATAHPIVEQGGDYVMLVKDNQPPVHQAIAARFAPAPLNDTADVDWHAALDQGHGRRELRIWHSQSVPPAEIDWPQARQVFSLERYTTGRTANPQATCVYGVTSLSARQAAAAHRQTLVRGYWSIENRSHYVRHVTFGEDLAQVRQGHLPQALAALRHAVISLIRQLDFAFIPDALAYFSARSAAALEAIGC